ncbi:MAG: hypothetical protein U0V87_00910 [Acidobacteriota bacterium]
MRQLSPRHRLQGTFRVPGDKSISHRALLFGAVASGKSRLRGLSRGADVGSTRRVLEAAGVEIRDEGESVVVEGRGWRGLDQSSSRHSSMAIAATLERARACCWDCLRHGGDAFVCTAMPRSHAAR